MSKSNRFVVKELLGEGGMGKVYRVVDRKLKRDCALKVANSKDDGYRTAERLVKEAWIWFQCRSIAHVVEVIEIVHLGDHQVGILMELMRGGNLRALISNKAPVSERIAAIYDIATGDSATLRL